jgi:hypothetical protein
MCKLSNTTSQPLLARFGTSPVVVFLKNKKPANQVLKKINDAVRIGQVAVLKNMFKSIHFYSNLP